MRVSLASVTRTVAQCVRTRREIRAAYVFGSVATGRAREDSDVDVAVLLGRPLPASRSLSYRLKLMTELGAALQRSDVDVIILNDASPLLAHRVLSKGKLAFERSASDRVRFQVKTAGLYADLMPMFETHIRYLKKRVREGRIVG
ncbi:MAG: nucleotidyltransferase domain-containing protein [Acidobacteria bacterium]|nr:nucleotidyltransferase domain-containing protein [Acidobacteriota bacterium]